MKLYRCPRCGAKLKNNKCKRCKFEVTQQESLKATWTCTGCGSNQRDTITGMCAICGKEMARC